MRPSSSSPTQATALVLSVPFVALLLAAGCAGAAKEAFGPRFPDNRSQDARAVVRRLEAQPAPDPAQVAAVAERASLSVLDLETGEVLWSEATAVEAGPYVAGQLVITQEANGVTGRALRTGRIRFTIDSEHLHLVGAHGEGPYAAIALSTGGGVGARSEVIVARDGSVDWRTQVEQAVGAPAVRAGLVFVPWANQNVSVLEAESGAEVARLRLDTVVGHALTRKGEVYVGQRGLFRFTESLSRGSRTESAYLELELGELPGRPALLRDAYQPPPDPQSARHRIRLEAAPVARGDGLQVAGEVAYLRFYRLVFALNVGDGSVRWARLLDHDVVGGRAVDAGFVGITEAGRVVLLDATRGAVRWERQFEARASTADLVVSGRLFASAEPANPPPVEGVRAQLLRAAQASDARLSPARVFAVERLGDVSAKQATADLIAVCDQPGVPATVREAACDALANRTQGPEFVLEALERHAAYLERVRPPPVGALARAAVSMDARSAVPKLLSHLRDPATPAEELPELLASLAKLGDRGAAGPIADFLRMYHADKPDEALVSALGVAAQALVELQGPVAEETLEPLAEDPLGIPEVRQAVRRILLELEAEAAESNQAAESEQEAESAPDEGATPQNANGDAEAPEEDAQTERRPAHITHAIVDRVLAPVMSDLQTCLLEAPSHPASARMVLRLDGEGRIEALSITPASVEECVEPLVRSQTFPGNRRHTEERVIYTIRR